MITFLRVTKNNTFKAIEKLATEIWHEHYTPIIGTAQIEYMLGKFQSVDAMQKQIEEGYEYYSILNNEKLIGYLSIQPRDGHLFLSKAYVQAKHRGNGYGQKAFDFVLKRARELGYQKIQLTVNKYNQRTIAVYEKYGFIKVKEAVFDIGQGYIMDDFVMECVTNSNQ
ncbi:MAG: GNAT family N-acetyltransferase [Bacteroidia bacterium]